MLLKYIKVYKLSNHKRLSDAGRARVAMLSRIKVDVGLWHTTNMIRMQWNRTSPTVMNQNNLSYYYITLKHIYTQTKPRTYIMVKHCMNHHHLHCLPSTKGVMHFTVPTSINTLPKANVLQTINTLIRILKCQLSLSTYISSAYYKANTSVQSISYSQRFCWLLTVAQENLFYPIPAHAQWCHSSNYLVTENMAK